MNLTLSELLAKQNANTLIITPSQRLALFLQDKLGVTETVMSMQTWLQQLWQQLTSNLTNSPRLISDYQAQLIWQQLINDSTYSDGLMQVRETAKLAYSAWQLVQLWGIPLTDPEFQHTTETHAFQQWAKQFQHYCDKAKICDSSILPAQLVALLKQHQLPEQNLYLVGFTEFSPNVQQCLTQLTQQHWQLQTIQLIATPTSHARQLALPDTDTEINCMVRWVSHLIKDSIPGSILCVVPNLTEFRYQLLHSFTSHLAPETLTQAKTTTPPLFDIAMGWNLSHYPLIITALQLLQLLKNQVDYSILRQLLHSPFIIGTDTEFQARTQFAQRLTELGVTHLSDTDIISSLPNNCAQLRQAFTQLHQLKLPRQAKPSKWCTVFIECLTIFAWPGSRKLNSAEYQLQQRWQKLLFEFAEFDAFLPSLTLSQALENLQQFANASLFQVENKQPRVHIMSMLEAAGLVSDHLWIMGMHDHAAPRSLKPNPFLPLILQHKHQLPQANTAREREFTTAILRQFEYAAPQVIFSYAQQHAEQNQQAHYYLRALSSINLTELNLDQTQTLDEIIFAAHVLETQQDDQGPKLDHTIAVQGGSGIFKAQAACPFRAFILYRLGIREPNANSLGLTQAERGMILHRTLQQIWQQLGDQQTLKNLDEVSFNQLLMTTIQAGFYALPKLRLKRLGKNFLQLERQRLLDLLHTWFEVERRRIGFQVIATEQTQHVEFAGLSFQIKWDRLDKLANDQHLLIDYKTGKCDLKQWDEARPDDPQLPLYALVNATPIDGIAFAAINAKKAELRGIIATTEQNTLIADLRIYADWPEKLATWKTVLENLAAEFKAGYAKVDPKKAKQTCERCQLQSVCRVRH